MELLNWHCQAWTTYTVPFFGVHKTSKNALPSTATIDNVAKWRWGLLSGVGTLIDFLSFNKQADARLQNYYQVDCPKIPSTNRTVYKNGPKKQFEPSVNNSEAHQGFVLLSYLFVSYISNLSTSSPVTYWGVSLKPYPESEIFPGPYPIVTTFLDVMD